MTLFELALLIATAGISGVTFAGLCNAVLERIGRHPAAQPVALTPPARR